MDVETLANRTRRVSADQARVTVAAAAEMMPRASQNRDHLGDIAQGIAIGGVSLKPVNRAMDWVRRRDR